MATSIWHVQAVRIESWVALAAVAVPLIVILVRQLTPWGVLALTAVTAVVPLLLAGRHEPEIAVASACRWGFAIYGLVWALLLAGRRRLESLWQSLQSTTTALRIGSLSRAGPADRDPLGDRCGGPDVPGRRPIDPGKPVERPDGDIRIREDGASGIVLDSSAADVGRHPDRRCAGRQPSDGSDWLAEHRLPHRHPRQLRIP